MEIKIELVPHVGEMQDPLLGLVEVEFDQFVVCASSENLTKVTGLRLLEIGYVGKSPGAPLNWLPPAERFAPNVRDAIEKKVRALIAGESSPEGETNAGGGESHKVELTDLVVLGESGGE